MGELRRVPLDFDWPLNKRWKGFVNPHGRDCPDAESGLCKDGQTAAGWWLDALCRFIAVMGREAASAPDAEHFKRIGRLYPHPYLTEWETAPRIGSPSGLYDPDDQSLETWQKMRIVEDWMEKRHGTPHPIMPLTPELQQFVEGLANTAGKPGSWHTISWPIQKRLRRMAKLPKNWGTCPTCKGEGIHPDDLAAYKAWKEEDPPTGEGFQLWETISEGSPVSPVFDTLDKLAEWCAANASPGGGARATKAQWMKMLDANYIYHEETLPNGNTIVFL